MNEYINQNLTFERNVLRKIYYLTLKALQMKTG